MSDLNIIFIWIPKNAGTTVYKSCKNAFGMIKQKYPTKQQVDSGVYTFAHQSIQRLVSKGNVSRDYVSNSFKFAVVRCPYERAVSLYCYQKNKSLRRLTSRFSPSPTFLEYLRILEKRSFLPLGIGQTQWRQTANPQSAWLNECNIDLMIPISKLKESLNQLFFRFTSHESESPIFDSNVNPHSDWRQFYCKQSKQLVEFLYQQDFDQLQHYDRLDFDVPDRRDYLLQDEYELPSRLRSKILNYVSNVSVLFNRF